jgi:hypothetical protein
LEHRKWLSPEKDGFTVCDPRGEELTRAEVNLEFSEPDAALARILHGTLRNKATTSLIWIISG